MVTEAEIKKAIGDFIAANWRYTKYQYRLREAKEHGDKDTVDKLWEESIAADREFEAALIEFHKVHDDYLGKIDGQRWRLSKTVDEQKNNRKSA